MTVLTDIAHLRENGFWPGNVVPAWAITLANTFEENPASLRVLLEGLYSYAFLREQALEDLKDQFRQDRKLLADALDNARDRMSTTRFAVKLPPVGPLLLIMGQGLVGAGRWQAGNTLNILWSEPAGAVASDFKRWLPIPQLISG